MKSMINFMNKHRIKSLFFVFVLLLFGSVTLTTKTRYVSYVSDYFAAVAGDFCFGSNYLAAPEDGVSYTISSWDKKKFTVTVQVQNYLNSLRYNQEDVNFYYVVEGQMYSDSACTEVTPGFTVTVEHSSSVETVVSDGITYAYLSGMSDFDKTAGGNNVTITAETTGSASDTQYLKVNAYTVPVLPMDSEEVQEHTYGVFYDQLEAVFVLEDSTGSTAVTSVLRQSDSNSEVQLRITCPEIPNASSQQLRVYYKTDVLTADTKTLPNPQSYDSEYNYSDITVNSSSITTVLLFKNSSGDVSLGDSASDMEDIYVEVLETETTESDDDTDDDSDDDDDVDDDEIDESME